MCAFVRTFIRVHFVVFSTIAGKKQLFKIKIKQALSSIAFLIKNNE